jgi:hypothetical protein
MISTPPAVPVPDAAAGSSALPSGPAAWVLVIVAAVVLVLLLVFVAIAEEESDAA